MADAPFRSGPSGLAGRIGAGPRWRLLLLNAIAGLVAALGQAPFGIWPATLTGLALGVWLFSGTVTRGRAALAGWALGAGYFTLTLIWIVQPFLVDIARHGWMAPFALAGMAGGMALFWGGGAFLARWLTPGGRLDWLALAAGIGAGEALRARLFGGFPWGGPGLVWIDTPVAQLATWVGVYGLGVASIAIAGALAASISRRNWPGLAATGAAALALWGGGIWLGQGDLPERDSLVTLRLIQPNAAQHLKWDPDFAPVFLRRAIEFTEAPAETQPDLIVWPETSVPYLLDHAPDVQATIAAAAEPARVAVGIQRGEAGRYFNALALLDDSGAPAAIYDKHHLVPFGEYIPLGNLMVRFGIRGFASQAGYGYTPGPGAEVLDLPGALGQALPLICYEGIFPHDIRTAPTRAGWILQITNDAWFGTFSGPQQHLVQARFRAIEFGLPFVRAANTGISAVIDARGQVTASLALNQPGYLDAGLPAALPATLYAKAGDLPLGLILLVTFAVLFRLRVRESR